MTRALALAPVLTVVVGCVPFGAPKDVSGNYDVAFADNLRVFLGDDLVADVQSGEDAAIDFDGQVFRVSQVCGDEGVACPAETYWNVAGVEQPWGPTQRLLNFVNLDPERGDLGDRIGGTMEEDGTFSMLSGLTADAYAACGSLGVGTVTGAFASTNDAIDVGVIAYAWEGGCRFGGVDVGVNVRLETDFTAVRSGPLDLSAIEAEPAVTTSGDPTATP
jgi:hypothetical protein